MSELSPGEQMSLRVLVSSIVTAVILGTFLAGFWVGSSCGC